MNLWHLNPDHSDAEARLFASLDRGYHPRQRDHGRVADLSGQLAAPAMRTTHAYRFAHNAPQWRVPPDNDRCRTRHIACSHEDRE